MTPEETHQDWIREIIQRHAPDLGWELDHLVSELATEVATIAATAFEEGRNHQRWMTRQAVLDQVRAMEEYPQGRPQDPGDGRVWVWLGGETPPRWELRGLGVIDG